MDTWDKLRESAYRALLRLPTPLPGLGEGPAVEHLLGQALSLVNSPRLGESDAGGWEALGSSQLGLGESNAGGQGGWAWLSGAWAAVAVAVPSCAATGGQPGACHCARDNNTCFLRLTGAHWVPGWCDCTPHQVKEFSRHDDGYMRLSGAHLDARMGRPKNSR